MPPTENLAEVFLTDKAVAAEYEDEFRRYPFAKRIAETIRTRQSADSLVIGLYGKWGLGKSSVLNFIEAELTGTNIITLTFNPWRFDGEEQLLIGFFADLSALLAGSGPIAESVVAKAIADYARKVVAKLALLSQHSNGEHAKEIKSQAAIEELKHRVGQLLHSVGKRVLILIDDIDRLATQEIQAIFRLVKLTGDFQYTTYLLAFDEELVASAIGEQYPGGGKTAGRRFLEKIIQVPLQLPVIQREAMQKYLESRLTRTLQLTGTQLTDGERQRLIPPFTAGIMPRIITPRHVSRYTNALSMVLPLLHGEVNTVDLLLVEALKVFYPKLYKLITKNQERFTGEIKSTSVSHIASHYNTVFGNNGSVFGEALPIFYALFPNLIRLYAGSFPFSEGAPTTEDELYSMKSVASAYYFKRYFSYAVQAGEIPEKSFSEFLDSMSQGNLPHASALASSMIERTSDLEFLRRLEESLPLVTAAQAAIYCELLLTISEMFSSLATTERAMRLLSRTSTLLLSYLNRLSSDVIIATTNHLLTDSSNLNLANDLLRDITSMGHWSDDTPLENFKAAITQDAYDNFNRIIVDRVLATIKPGPWYKSFNYNGIDFLNTWYRAYGQEGTTNALQSIFDQDNKELLNFLQYMSPAFQTRDNPTPQYLSLDLELYNKLKDFVDIEYLVQKARSLAKEEAPIQYVHNNPRHIPSLLERAYQLLHFYDTDAERVIEEV